MIRRVLPRRAWLAAATLLLVARVSAGTGPTSRPPEWAQPVVPTSLGNCFRVSDELFRSAQPRARDLPALEALGIRAVLDLRRYHADSDEFRRAGFALAAEGMGAGSVTVAQLVAALRKFRAAPKPVLVHCWHGSDRTGFFVAGYRIIIQEWAPEAAIAELEQGGFGFSPWRYRNIVRCLAEMDVASVRRQVLGPETTTVPGAAAVTRP
jgi:protein tyrosine phosphatase (PTP) superfamily phosphohydrolase (DUF442 family)